MTAPSVETDPRPTDPRPAGRHGIYDFGDRPIAFVHIPRTGGTSLLSGLAEGFPRRSVFPAHRLEAFMEATGGVRRPEGGFVAVRRLTGHQFYRAHLGPDDFAAFIADATAPITMVRDPVAMLASVYRHARRQSVGDPILAAADDVDVRDPAYVYADKLCFLAQRCDLLGFVERMMAIPAFFAPITWYLTVGRGGRRPDDPDLRPLSAAAAIARLDDFAFVGLTERYDDSVALLKHVLGWPQGRFPHLHALSSETVISARDAEARALIHRLAEVDREVHDHARRRFEREWAAASGRFEAVYEREFPHRHGRRERVEWCADDGVLGAGWLPPQIDVEGDFAMIWSGGDAFLDLPLHCDRPLAVEIALSGVADRNCLRDFTLEVNGVGVPLSREAGRDGAVACRGVIPAAAFAGPRGFARFRFRVPEPRVIDGSGRPVGIGLRGVRAWPVGSDR